MGVEEAASIIFDLAKGLRGNHTLKWSYTIRRMSMQAKAYRHPIRDKMRHPNVYLTLNIIDMLHVTITIKVKVSPVV